MNVEEYATMYRVENQHWWYQGLRNMLAASWRRHVAVAAPRVLDAGCGTGATLAAWTEDAHSFGIDISPHALHYCRVRGLTRTTRASVTALPFPPSSFDIALSLDVIQHQAVPDKSLPLREIHRVLVSGGILFINVPAYQWLHSSHDTAVATDHRFTKSELLSLLAENGFEPIEITYWNTLLFPPATIVRLWRKVRPPEGSDLASEPGKTSSTLFGGVLACERAVIRLAPLPFGLSIFAAARKK